MSTNEKVRKIIEKQLIVPEGSVEDDSKLVDDLGADSLDLLELVMEIEDGFDLIIPDEDVEDISTVKEVIVYIESKV